MALFGTGTLVASLVSGITASAAMGKAGGAVSGTILAASQGLNLLAQTALGSGASVLGSALGVLKVGTILSGCPASVLAVCPTGAMTVAAVPPVLSAVGFTGTGIAASSLAAKMMSLSAIANGGGVAAGSLVATLQSVGKCQGKRTRMRADIVQLPTCCFSFCWVLAGEVEEMGEYP
ncbi:interferon alpha-inducible protein 27-like protein 2B [Peromyscus leucopus]|uniref:interferon alpha-inducible protein 27-like protein 2B n=1 Tax=Peromyscus leucopus TaxID=10041 RepID=UPI001885421C|nr:interferon alpha-inducible protein 27-like protein 2B [Peromyscus leucopus]